MITYDPPSNHSRPPKKPWLIADGVSRIFRNATSHRSRHWFEDIIYKINSHRLGWGNLPDSSLYTNRVFAQRIYSGCTIPLLLHSLRQRCAKISAPLPQTYSILSDLPLCDMHSLPIKRPEGKRNWPLCIFHGALAQNLDGNLFTQP